MQRIILLLVATLVFSITPLFAQETTSTPLTQRDWLINLVEGMGWSFGLPEEPEDSHYLAIVSGQRTFRIEAEDAKDPTDPVSVKDFVTFGPYSGRGWVSGSVSPATLHLRFILPTGGLYRLSTAVRLAGHEVVIGNRSFRLDGTNRFTKQDFGEIELSAGEIEIVVQIPPNGSLDYIELQAPDLPSIAPLGGWDLDTALTADDMAVTTIQLLELTPLVPLANESVKIEAETAANFGTAERTEIRHLGAASGNAWLRAGAVKTTVQIDFDVPETGIYTLALRALGSSPLTGRINDRLPFTREFPLFLKELEIGTWFLDRGGNTFNVTLPPRGGVDVLTLKKRGKDAKDLLRLTGLLTESQPTTSSMDALISLLSVLAMQR